MLEAKKAWNPRSPKAQKGRFLSIVQKQRSPKAQKLKKPKPRTQIQCRSLKNSFKHIAIVTWFFPRKLNADFNAHTLGTFLESPLFRNKI